LVAFGIGVHLHPVAAFVKSFLFVCPHRVWPFFVALGMLIAAPL
jgi:hypothetical protein